MQLPYPKPVGLMHLVHPAQAQALTNFQKYLHGFRGLGRPLSQPKVAIVKTAGYTLALEHDPDASSDSSTLSCWTV